jgi:hypothetical protein
LHTNLTNIKSELRNFITYNGRKLVSIDIRNSQPVMLTSLLNSEFWNQKDKSWNSTTNSQRLIHNSNILSNNINTLSNNPSNNIITFYNLLTNNINIPTSSLIMLAELIERVYNKEDIELFKKSVSEGMLYETIEEKLKVVSPESLKNIKSRKELKALIFVVLFTDNRYIGQEDAEPKRLFQQLFPNVYEIAAVVKKHEKSALPILLQKIESKLVLERVVARILNEKPTLPIFTIHDSVVTLKGYEAYVETVMKEEIVSGLGISPTLSMEYWEPSSLNGKSLNSEMESNWAIYNNYVNEKYGV